MLHAHEKMWVMFLICFSGLARAAILMLPFRWLSLLLGHYYHNIQLATLVTSFQLNRAKWIGRMTGQVARQTPWQSKCLVQAMMARCMLAYYGIPYVLYLGVNKAENHSEGQYSNALVAHAWISVGSSVIVGDDGYEDFTIVSTFVDPCVLQSGHRPHRHGSHAI